MTKKELRAENTRLMRELAEARRGGKRDPATGLDPWPTTRPAMTLVLDALGEDRRYVVDARTQARLLMIGHPSKGQLVAALPDPCNGVHEVTTWPKIGQTVDCRRCGRALTTGPWVPA